MTLLATTCTDFLGSNFVIGWLKQRDESVITIDNPSYTGNLKKSFIVEYGCHHAFVKRDIDDQAPLEKPYEKHKPKALINFAAESRETSGFLKKRGKLQLYLSLWIAVNLPVSLIT